MTFRDRLVATIYAAGPVLELPGILVVGSEVPNLLEPEGTRVRLPRIAGLLLEKLITDRTGEKGERDLLVALGLLAAAGPADLDELERMYRNLRAELRYVVRSNLTVLPLIEPRMGMPDPRLRRGDIAELLQRLEGGDRGRS